MAFTAADVKTLREMTSVGMMDCKKALVECDGDMDKAVEWLREKGLAKAAKKAGRIAAEGTPLTLKNTYTGDFITLYGITEEQVKTLGASYESIRDAYRVFVKDTSAATELILRYPEIFRDYEITKGKMDDVFLAVTGKKLTGGEEK